MKLKKYGSATKGTKGAEVCDLECQSKGQQEEARHEFVGPVKIVLIESTPEDYKRKVWGSAVFTFVMLLLGATVFTVFFFTLKFQLPFAMNVHVMLCTMGFQLFMTTGIMMFSSLFGGSMYLPPAERKFHHFFLETSGVFVGVLGSVFALAQMDFTLHALTGFIAAALSITSSFVGPQECTRNSERLFLLFNKNLHRKIAVPTFILCTVCFAQGLMKESFVKWMPCKHLHLILLVFTAMYSVTALAVMVLRILFEL